MKTHKGMAKRVKKTKKGILKKKRANQSHLLTKKSQDRIRAFRKEYTFSKADQKNVTQLLK